jgi:RNA polymerase sigma-70 factor (sigma-E family)
VESSQEFTEFAGAAGPRLRRTAFPLCGDWHTAQDLTQMTLAKVFVAWRRISRSDAVDAYARRTLVNTYLAMRRKRDSSEIPVSALPETAGAPDMADLRIVLLQALRTLAPRARAVVVLRYLEDLSIDQVAVLLDCSPGNVKSLSSQAMKRLRAQLGDSLAEGGPADLLPASQLSNYGG